MVQIKEDVGCAVIFFSHKFDGHNPSADVDVNVE